MKKIILSLFAIVLSLAVTKAFAQQASDPTTVAGHFNMETMVDATPNHINVNYALFPAPFTKTVNVALSTPQPTLFNVDIVNANNTVVATWTPNAISHSYQHAIDISALPSGSYHVNIRKDGKAGILHTIPFVK